MTVMQRTENIFCVGSIGSGKTILLKKLEQKEEQDWHELVSSTIPTVGINHFEIDANRCGVLDKVNVKELGGELAQNWRLYLKQQCESSHRINLIYVIDISNPSLVPEVSFHLRNCLKLLPTRSKDNTDKSSVLIVYSKVDVVQVNYDYDAPNQSIVEVKLERFRSLLRIQDLRHWYRNTAYFEEVSHSHFEDQGLVLIKDWIRRTNS